jgi:hypothetical protein
MMRRNFLATSAGGGLVAPSVAAPSRNSILLLHYLRMRNGADEQMKRTTDFLSQSMLPAYQRAGIGPIGFFTPLIAPRSPFILSLIQYRSLAAMEEAQWKLTADRDFLKDVAEFDALPGLNYVRAESSVLYGFDAVPGIEVPPTDGRRPVRVFELRTYESNNSTTLRTKIKMFNQAEIAVFRKCGLLPVFFGQTIIGPDMPNLTYMVAFDDLAGREKAWKTFVDDAEWKKLRVVPEYTDAKIVANVSNSILRPLPFSAIR